MAKGYRGGKSRLYRTATEAVDRALCYAYRDRRTNKRNFRRLWITRLSAAAEANGTNYSKLIHGLKQSGIELDRKVLSNLAIVDPKAFSEVVKTAGISNA
jgi:large subunit ribosomal protein L20